MRTASFRVRLSASTTASQEPPRATELAAIEVVRQRETLSTATTFKDQ